MLTIENGRFSECVFVDNLKNKNIKLNRYRDKKYKISGLIVKIVPSEDGYKVWVDINGYPNMVVSFNLHNIENANIF